MQYVAGNRRFMDSYMDMYYISNTSSNYMHRRPSLSTIYIYFYETIPFV